MYRTIRRPLLLFTSIVLLAVAACGPGKDDPDAGPDTVADASDVETDGDTTRDPDTPPPEDENCQKSELPALSTTEVASGLDNVVLMTQAPGDADTYYIVERPGRILLMRDGTVLDEPFLDISDQVVSSYGEQGLLGLAFHPNFQENGRFFIDYTSNGEWRDIVAEYERDPDNPDKAQPDEVRRLVNIKDPKKQHNGGTLAFGPEGYLYASLGNAGAMEKTKHGGIGQAQYIENVFGTIMRMDVDNVDGNFAAPGNPFADQDKGDGRIYAYGLRNPWRFSIDQRNGDMYIADVGKKSWEEINFIGGESGGGQNFGWPAYLGDEDGPVETAKKAVDEHATPLFAYRYRSQEAIVRNGCAVIGGEFYQGDKFPSLKGYYLYSDLCSNDMAALKYCDTDDNDAEPELIHNARFPDTQAVGSVRAIVADNSGDLFLIGKGTIRRLEKK
jgi:glucose/arabinose dehydrogenase